jgi:hypothetical protein
MEKLCALDHLPKLDKLRLLSTAFGMSVGQLMNYIKFLQFRNRPIDQLREHATLSDVLRDAIRNNMEKYHAKRASAAIPTNSKPLLGQDAQRTNVPDLKGFGLSFVCSKCVEGNKAGDLSFASNG